MELAALLAAALLAAAPVLQDERPLWAGTMQANTRPVLVSAVPGGIGVRSSAAAAVIGGDVTAALGPGLCPGSDPRLAIPTGSRVHLLGLGSPARLVATATLPSQAVSAAVPVTTAAGCRHAVVLQTGDVALVGPSGAVETVTGVVPPIVDWHEFPRGVLATAKDGLLVVGGADGTVAAVQLEDGSRHAGKIALAAIPGAVWSDGRATVWFLGKGGTLYGWRVTTDVPVPVAEGTTAAPGGLVAWGGKANRGIAWADMQGDVRSYQNGVLRKLIRLPAGVRWPMLVADLEDSGDLRLVAPVDGSVAALVADGADGASFTLLPLAARPAGPPVAFHLDRTEPTVLAIPAGSTRGAFRSSDGPPAGRLRVEQSILNPGSQQRGVVAGPVVVALDDPPWGGGNAAAGAGSGAATGGSADSGITRKAGFSCSSTPAQDGLPLLLAPLLLLLRRRSGPRATPHLEG